MENEHIQWSRNLFDGLNEGGAWGIPKCGLIFRKRGGMMVLTDQMPHEEGMPISAERLLEEQQAMYDDCKRHFEAAGIPVLIEVNLKREP